MLTRILWVLGAEWTLGYAGMLVTRVLAGQATDDVLFRAFSRLWLIGGIGFLATATCALLAWTWAERDEG